MDQDRPEESPRAPSPLVSAPDRGLLGGWGLLGAGVVGACALGVVAGVWARPGHEEAVLRRADAKAALGAEVPRRIRILVDEVPPAPDPPPVQIAAAAAPVTLGRPTPAPAAAPAPPREAPSAPAEPPQIAAPPMPRVTPVKTPPPPRPPA